LPTLIVNKTLFIYDRKKRQGFQRYTQTGGIHESNSSAQKSRYKLFLMTFHIQCKQNILRATYWYGNRAGKYPGLIYQIPYSILSLRTKILTYGSANTFRSAIVNTGELSPRKICNCCYE